MYIQWLSNSHSSPSTIKNYLSGAKTWVLEHKGSILSFASYESGQMLKSITKHSNHIVRRAAPLFEDHLRTICSYCDFNLAVPLSVKPCILLGHALFLRASNLVSPSMDVWGGPHTLRVNDVHASTDKLVIRIASTKTRVTPSYVTVPSNRGSSICPVLAWNTYVQSVAPSSHGPAFIIHHNRSLTSKFVVTCMRQALMFDPSIDASNISMHSLRRGAAQSAVLSGSSPEQIMSAGSWASHAGLKPYLSD